MNEAPAQVGAHGSHSEDAPDPAQGESHPTGHCGTHAEPVCPYCGATVPASAGRIGDVGTRCPSCKGLLDELSIHATRGHMGEWFVRDEAAPFRPGCSLATLRAMIDRGRVNAMSVVRGPDTEQFWHRAGHVPRIARLMGLCPECGLAVAPDASECASCGTHLMSLTDAQAEGHWHGNALAAAVARPASAEIAEAAVKRQMQREVQTWARRAGLSIGIAGFLFLIVIGLATKGVWWGRARGENRGPSVPAVAAPTPVASAPIDPPQTKEPVAPKASEPAPAASEPATPNPGPAVRSGRDAAWEQVGPLVIADTTESLKHAEEILRRIADNAGAERANEREQANALREWIERRLAARELSVLP